MILGKHDGVVVDKNGNVWNFIHLIRIMMTVQQKVNPGSNAPRLIFCICMSTNQWKHLYVDKLMKIFEYWQTNENISMSINQWKYIYVDKRMKNKPWKRRSTTCQAFKILARLDQAVPLLLHRWELQITPIRFFNMSWKSTLGGMNSRVARPSRCKTA